MTKTLTEQWREGTLPEGCYYILEKNGHVRTERTCFYSYIEEQCFCFTSNKDIEEVLAPVPSYDEWKQAKENIDKDGTWYTERSYKRIETQLEIATKALNGIRDVLANNPRQFSYIARIANRKAKKELEEMEGVK